MQRSGIRLGRGSSNLPANHSTSRSRITHPIGNRIVGYQSQRGIRPSGSNNLPSNYYSNEAGQNAPHQPLSHQPMTEIPQQRTIYSYGTSHLTYAQVAQQGHAMSTMDGAPDWPTGYSEEPMQTVSDTYSFFHEAFPPLLSQENLYESHQEGFPKYHQEQSLQHTKMGAKRPATSRSPEPTHLETHRDINSHEEPWSIMNPRGDQGPMRPVMPQPQGMQHLDFGPSIPSASTKTTTTTTMTTSTLSIKCPHCSKHFSGKHGKGNMGRHRRQVHGSSPQSFQCKHDGCDRSYKRKDARLKHYRNKHQSDSSQEPIGRPTDQDYYYLGLGNA